MKLGRNRFVRQLEQRGITVAGTLVHYHETGTEGSPLILIHGLSCSTRWWLRNLTGLGERCHVYAIDLPGFGANRSWGRFTLADAHLQLGAWMEALGIARASIVGHSMGGLIAADFARHSPERVDRLILVDAPIVSDSRGWVRFGLECAAEVRRFSPQLLPLLVSDAFRAGPFTIGRGGRAIRLRNLQSQLEDITVPTLVIWGEHDRMFPPDYGRRVAAALPDASFALIAGAGHNAMWDCPNEFNRLVLDFIT